MSLAVVVIASEKRRETTFRSVLESVLRQAPDEIVVVADFPCEAKGVRSLVVPAMLRNTIDALVKRDVGYMATTADHICYLCDDHELAPDFVRCYMERYANRPDWDLLVPSRYTVREGARIWLNVGRDLGYAGGHCSIESRVLGYALPWAATLHDRLWDLIRSHQLVQLGARLMYADTDLSVVDIEGGTPWL